MKALLFGLVCRRLVRACHCAGIADGGRVYRLAVSGIFPTGRRFEFSQSFLFYLPSALLRHAHSVGSLLKSILITGLKAQTNERSISRTQLRPVHHQFQPLVEFKISETVNAVIDAVLALAGHLQPIIARSLATEVYP